MNQTISWYLIQILFVNRCNHNTVVVNVVVFYIVLCLVRIGICRKALQTEHHATELMHLQANCARCPDGIVYLLSALFYQNTPKMSAECNLHYNASIHHLIIVESPLS